MAKRLTVGSIFGDLKLLGQTMLMARAISGDAGAMLAVMDLKAAKRWLESDSIRLVEKIGPRLACADEQHYRAIFQNADSRIAALLLEIAGEGTTVAGLTQAEMGEVLGVYRETVATMLKAMKEEGLIDVDRKMITLLDKRALRELSEF
jgi:CRP-like cAMP-binding protein